MTTYPFAVSKRRQETGDTASLWFDVPADLRTAFAYRTGQFVAIEEELAGESVTRQYSLASVPELDGNRLQITVKRVSGGRMSTWLVDEVAEGDLIEMAPPRGRLYTPAAEPRHYILLAAGSGIVPLYAIARHASARLPGTPGAGHRVTLAYGNRTADSVILRAEVDALTGAGVNVEHVLSRPPADWAGASGHVDPAYLAARWDDWTADGLPVSVMLCGPDAFMTAAEEYLAGRGVPLDDIRKESFDLVLNDDEDEPGLLVPEDAADAGAAEGDCALLTAMYLGDELTVTPEKGEPLLTALLRVSDDVPYSCQEGTCASCIVRLRRGQVSVRPGVLKTLRPGDLKEGMILACLSRATTEHVHIDFDDI